MQKYILGALCLFFYQSIHAQGYEPRIVIDDSFGMTRPNETQIADVDHDGFLDIIAAGNDKIAWFKSSNGTGNYTRGKIVNDNFSSYIDLATGDIDNDGDIDIAFSCWGNNIQNFYWCKNTDGQGNFGTPTLLVSGGLFSNNKIQIVDVDADNDLDIMISSITYLSFFENTTGTGTFTERLIAGSHTSSATSVSKFVARNVDSEPRAEIITVVNGVLNCYKINPNYTVSLVDSITSNAFSDTYEVVDLNNDGFQDIVTSYSNGNTKKLQWFKNLTGAGVFGTAQNMVNMPSNASTNGNGNDEKRVIALADLDNDNKPDIVHIDSNIASAHWYKNMGNGVFSMQQLLITTQQNIRDVKIIDANQDGFNDILLTVRGEDKIVWYKNTNGAGTFGTENPITYICYVPNSVDYGDIDHDGDYDLVSSSGSDGKLAWYKNTDGLGGFSEPQQVIVRNLASAGNAQLGDIDNDGDLDIVATSWYQNSGNFSTLVWYKNSDGQGTFNNPQVVVSNTEQILKIKLTDIDQDQDLDIVCGSYNNILTLYKNNGNGTFAAPVVFSTLTNNMYLLDLVVADLDNDNDSDVLVSFNNNEIAWYENTDGLGNLTTKRVIVPSMFYPMSLFAADIDGDNLKEVIFCNRNQNKIGYFKNLGSGNFAALTLITVSGLFHPAICMAQDLDQDGDQDLIFDNETGSKLFYLLNDGLGNFSAPVDIYTSSYNTSYNQNIRSLKSVDLNADGKLDMILADINENKIVWLKNLGALENRIVGNIKIDANNNGCDAQDNPVPNALVTTQSGAVTFSTFSDAQGNYELSAGVGQCVTSVVSPEANYTANPDTYTTDFTLNNQTENANFCLQPTALFNDLRVIVYPITNARAGFVSKYKIVIKNVGTAVVSGDVTFSYNFSKFDYISSSTSVTTQTNNSLTYTLANLPAFSSQEIEVWFQVKTIPSVSIGESVVFTCTIDDVADVQPNDNQFVLHQTILNAYDPNDIRVLEGSQVLIDHADEYLHYIIRFQNTGNSFAQRVNILNQLDEKLDWNSIQLESFSHDNRVEIKDGNLVNFIFDAIYLPNAADDYNGSQGYISYKIKPKSNVVVGDVINNQASIIFDYNPAINTNTEQTEFVGLLSNADHANQLNQVRISPNPVQDWLMINGKASSYQVAVYSQIGQLVAQGEYRDKIDLSFLNTGIYIIKITDNYQNTICQKIIKL